MLALALVVVLGQCTKDTDCKGERICAAGACVDLPERLQRPAAEPAPPVLVPAPPAEPSAEDVRTQRMRLMYIGRLETELRQLREELDDTTLAGPVVKIIGATVLAVLAAGLLVSWDRNPNGTATMFWSAIGSGVLSAGLYVWGGVQMHLRLNALRELPVRIGERETELAELLAQSRR